MPWTPAPCAGALSGTKCSAHALDDAEVALGAVAERLERLLVGGSVVRGHGLVDVVELDDHHALLHTELVHARWQRAHDEFAARLLYRRDRELGVRLPLRLVGDLAVGDDDIAFAHDFLLSGYILVPNRGFAMRVASFAASGSFSSPSTASRSSAIRFLGNACTASLSNLSTMSASGAKLASPPRGVSALRSRRLPSLSITCTRTEWRNFAPRAVIAGSAWTSTRSDNAMRRLSCTHASSN